SGGVWPTNHLRAGALDPSVWDSQGAGNCQRRPVEYVARSRETAVGAWPAVQQPDRRGAPGQEQSVRDRVRQAVGPRASHEQGRPDVEPFNNTDSSTEDDRVDIPPVKQCTAYLPGHSVHWIQVRLSYQSPGQFWTGTIVSIDREVVEIDRY